MMRICELRAILFSTQVHQRTFCVGLCHWNGICLQQHNAQLEETDTETKVRHVQMLKQILHRHADTQLPMFSTLQIEFNS